MNVTEHSFPASVLCLVFRKSGGGLLDFRSILLENNAGLDPLLSARPFEVLNSEKITLDLGPWMKHVR